MSCQSGPRDDREHSTPNVGEIVDPSGCCFMEGLVCSDQDIKSKGNRELEWGRCDQNSHVTWQQPSGQDIRGPEPFYR